MQRLGPDGVPIGPVETVAVEGVARLEAALPGLRWVFDQTSVAYHALLRAGVRLGRAHDVWLVERLLRGREGGFGEPCAAAAVVARRDGAEPPPDPVTKADDGLPALFTTDETVDDAGPEILAAALRDQLSRLGSDGALKLLAAVDSTGALLAVEMGAVGMPFDAGEHRRLLEEALGSRPPRGGRPSALEELAGKINAAFGFEVNADSPASLKEGFRRAGFDVDTTRAWVLRELDHPAVAPVLEYKELARLWSANGWSWLDEWVTEGRFHAEYVPAGVVSGRWAARGGGALQIPKLVRQAVIADPGYVFVVADAAQLEPRVLAAISGDPVLQAISESDDLYAALAADAFAGDRAKAKVAMLGAMYGATTGASGRLLPILRSRYPVAMNYVEAAARQGERGECVRSVLGRASPPPGQNWRDTVLAGALPDASAGQERRGQQVARSWGRFTRNFVVQGSAADWAGVWLSVLRQELFVLPGAELVFFQHDEIVVHCPEPLTDAVRSACVTAAETARRLVFPGAAAQLPVRPVVVRRYSEAK